MKVRNSVTIWGGGGMSIAGKGRTSYPEKRHIHRTPGPARRAAWLAGGKWPSRASFVGDGSFRVFPMRAHFSPE
jgi:hypothetical protein